MAGHFADVTAYGAGVDEMPSSKALRTWRNFHALLRERGENERSANGYIEELVEMLRDGAYDDALTLVQQALEEDEPTSAVVAVEPHPDDATDRWTVYVK